MSAGKNNLSTRHQREGDAAHPKDTLDKDQTDRGRPAGFDRKTGEVHGSGAGAGGNNPGEDYDGDPMGGGGDMPVGGPRPIDKADHGPRDRHEGSPR